MSQGEGFQLCCIPMASLVPPHRRGCARGRPSQGCHHSPKPVLAKRILVNQLAVFTHFTNSWLTFLFSRTRFFSNQIDLFLNRLQLKRHNLRLCPLAWRGEPAESNLFSPCRSPPVSSAHVPVLSPPFSWCCLSIAVITLSWASVGPS